MGTSVLKNWLRTTVSIDKTLFFHFSAQLCIGSGAGAPISTRGEQPVGPTSCSDVPTLEEIRRCVVPRLGTEWTPCCPRRNRGSTTRACLRRSISVNFQYILFKFKSKLPRYSAQLISKLYECRARTQPRALIGITVTIDNEPPRSRAGHDLLEINLDMTSLKFSTPFRLLVKGSEITIEILVLVLFKNSAELLSERDSVFCNFYKGIDSVIIWLKITEATNQSDWSACYSTVIHSSLPSRPYASHQWMSGKISSVLHGGEGRCRWCCWGSQLQGVIAHGQQCAGIFCLVCMWGAYVHMHMCI